MSRGILLGMGVIMGSSGGQGHRCRSPSFRTQDRTHNKGCPGPRCEDPPPGEAQLSLTGSWSWGPGGTLSSPLGLRALAIFNIFSPSSLIKICCGHWAPVLESAGSCLLGRRLCTKATEPSSPPRLTEPLCNHCQKPPWSSLTSFLTPN